MARVIACKWAPGMCDPAHSPGRATRTYLLRIGGRVREIEEAGNTYDAVPAASEAAYDELTANSRHVVSVHDTAALRATDDERGTK